MTDLPVRAGVGSRRVMPLITVVGVLLLLLAGALMVIHNEQSYRETKTQQVDAQAQILASTVSAALVFDDRKAAQEYLNALGVDSEIHGAAIYDAAGALFAAYSREANVSLPKSAGQVTAATDSNTLVVSTPVRQGANTVGSVYLQTITEPLSRRLERYAVVALIVTMATLIFIVLGVTQNTLAKANARLEHQGLELMRTNAELRTQIEQREKIETALRQAQKMEAIGQLTGGIAHDFNNLLQVIIGNLEVFRLRNFALSEDGWRMIDGATRGAARAATLTARLLAFSRRQPLNPKPLDVNKLVLGMSELLRRALGEGLRIETVLAGGVWRISADANQLENALLNLCVNARDAMQAGGKLTIETANAFLDEAYALAQETTSGQYVVLAVSDTGTGMTEDVMHRAFEPFFTTKDVGKGSGLGLSQVYGYIRQSGGHAKIYSEVGEGTTVKLYLPRLLTGDGVEVPIANEQVPRGRSDRKILVVEDDDDVRAHALAILRELGYGVLEAADGAAALRILEVQNDVDLLFTDVGLPGGMNGRQLADEARLRYNNLLVLFTTGYARNAIVHHGRLDPGVDLIPKPFTYVDLANKVHRMLKARDAPDAAATQGGEPA